MVLFELTVQAIADIIGGIVDGDGSTLIRSIDKIETADKGSITFFANERFAHLLATTEAGCVICKDKNPELSTTSIIHPNPYGAIITLIEYLQDTQIPEIHSTAVIAPTSVVSDSASISAHCVIGKNVRIGDNTILFPGVVVYDDCVIGNNCIVHANTVIGSDGFGYMPDGNGGYKKIPQIGNVVIGDNVEIGANVCIDRAALGSTIIHDGVKIDNLVHIAHNVEIHENTAIAAQAGIAGGTTVGKRNRIAGQVGMVGYITTADDITVGAQAGVSKSLTKKGEYSGSPAVELRQRLRQDASIRRLPDWMKTVDETLKRLSE
jgi:UDP-3-O-[3-hydroxymyristoyl] glucosamine N-acyltransferase